MATRVASAVAAPAAMAVVLTRDHGAAVLAYVLGLTVCWMYATTQVMPETEQWLSLFRRRRGRERANPRR